MWTILLACSHPDASPTASTEDPWDPNAPLRDRCFAGFGDPANGPLPQYDQFDPVVPRSCAGTAAQHIGDLDRVVFVGDSITTGTWPTLEQDFYRNRLVADLEADLGHPLETQDCSRFGARVDDLYQDDDQLVQCLGDSGVDQRATLLVFTSGGNDLFAFAQDMLAGATQAQADAEVDEAAGVFGTALDWLADARETRFPNGLYVVFGNVYEYTDGTGDLSVCPSAEILGFSGVLPEMREVGVRLNEAWVRLAVEHGFDVVFLLEHFCGHGFLAQDPTNECYRGADAETWFDPTCIHPTPEGHEQLADLFHTVVRGE
jgi:hypothetical protein